MYQILSFCLYCNFRKTTTKKKRLKVKACLPGPFVGLRGESCVFVNHMFLLFVCVKHQQMVLEPRQDMRSHLILEINHPLKAYYPGKNSWNVMKGIDATNSWFWYFPPLQSILFQPLCFDAWIKNIWVQNWWWCLSNSNIARGSQIVAGKCYS